MALEAVVFPRDLFSTYSKDLYSLAASLSYDFKLEDVEIEGILTGECDRFGGSLDRSQGEGSLIIEGLQGNRDSSYSSNSLLQSIKDWDVSASSPDACIADGLSAGSFPAGWKAGPGRRKRRRGRSGKNMEEVENQRMTHIAVERNRRKQMNEYLSVLRSLMPESYVQRGDQASIVGGAINFVKELEQLVQSLEAQKQMKEQSNNLSLSGSSSTFAEFFIFPQFSSNSGNSCSTGETAAKRRSVVADIEVTMIESHANLKLLSKKRPKQLLKLVASLQNLHLTILHLNVTTTVDQMALYTFSLKVEDVCWLKSVDEIATAVYEMLGKIQEDSNLI